MPLGMVLADWDNQLGPDIKAISPKGFKISQNEINKLLISHSISEKQVPEIIELHTQEHIILSYSCKDKITTKGYGMLILVLANQESQKIQIFKPKLKEIGQRVFDLSGFEKIKTFHDYSRDLLFQESTRKIVIIGPSGVGKSTIKTMFFEGVSSEELLSNPLEPTYGLEYFNYDWLDLDVGIADLAGQEIDRFLDEPTDFEMNPFLGADLVLFIFDADFWQSDSKKVVTYLNQVDLQLKDNNSNATIHVFCHKIDLIEEENRDKFQNEVKYTLPLQGNNQIYFTSIKPHLISNLIRAMQSIMGAISPRMSDIEAILYESISNYTNTIAILINTSKILLEVSTKDFPLVNLEDVRTFFKTSQNFMQIFGSDQTEFSFITEKFEIYVSPLESSVEEVLFLLSRSLSASQLKKLYETIQYSIFYLDTDFYNQDSLDTTIVEKSENPE